MVLELLINNDYYKINLKLMKARYRKYQGIK